MRYFQLIFICLLYFLPGIASIPMLDRDSAHFAQASKQMLETGNYLKISFQDEPRHLKPPGIYWLQTLAVKTFSSPQSISVWPYRIPALLSAILSVLLLFSAIKLCGSESTAFLAAVILASTVLLNIEVRQTVTDSTLLTCTLLMLTSLFRLYLNGHKLIHLNPRQHNFWRVCFWLGMALGMLIKGITPLFAFLICLPLSLIERSNHWVRQLRLGWGILGVVFLTLVWLIPLSRIGHSNFLFDMISQDLLPKVVGGARISWHAAGIFCSHFYAHVLAFFFILLARSRFSHRSVV